MPADSHALLEAMLKGGTPYGPSSAGSNVRTTLTRRPVLPCLTHERRGGGRNRNNKRLAEARHQVSAWGASEGEASDLINEVSGMMVPETAQGVQGFWGHVEVPGAGSVFVYDVIEEVAATWLPDEESGLARYFAVYVVKHY